MTSARDLADRVHRRWLESNPFAATMYGVPGYDDLVPDESEEGRQAWRAEIGRFLGEADVIAGGQLTPAEAVTLDCARAAAAQEQDMIDLAGAEHTVTAMQYAGPAAFLAVTARTVLVDQAAAEAYLSRLRRSGAWLDQIAGRIDLRVQQLALDVETKTKDNVFVKIPVSVQYHVIPDKVYEAFYKLANPKQQISSYVFNVILGHVPKMILDDAFLQQSDIAVAIKEGLDDVMKTYGYAIDQALVTDIEPDEKVKSAMNEINAAQREQVAASARGEAEKILKVKQAEAEAESKALQGQGIANQRKAIIDGLKVSVESFAAAVEGSIPDRSNPSPR